MLNADEILADAPLDPERVILAVVSDLHAGHKLAVCPPGTTVYDEGPEGELIEKAVELSEVQRYLWNLYKQFIDEVADHANGAPVVLLVLGDPTHGNRHPEQLLTTRMADQISIARALLRPWMAVPGLQCMRLVVGTGSHEFGEGSASIILADHLKEVYPDYDISAVYHGLADVGGVVVDYTHHGPGDSSRTWLHGNSARYYTRDLMMREMLNGNEPPSLVLRGHVHVRVNEVVTVWANDYFYECRTLVVPSFCMLSDYARQRTRSAFQVTNGGVWFEIQRGFSSPPRFVTKTVDIRTEECLIK